MAREILNATPDAGVLFREYHEGGERDPTGLALGPVTRHYEGRLLVSYQVLCVFAGLRDIRVFDGPVTVTPAGDPPQDKQVSGAEQAAHRLPSDLKVTLASGRSDRVYDFFENIFSKGWIKDLFARTDRVHRFTNKADSDCEKRGMRDALAQACMAVANGERVTPLEVLEGRLVADYGAAVQAAIRFNRAELLMTATPGDGSRIVDRHGNLLTPQRADHIAAAAARSPLVDRFGHPALARPADLSVRSSNEDARIANRRSVIQVLETYAQVALAPTHLLAHAAGQVEAIIKQEAAFRR